jgi:hypothetical protein
MRSVVLVAGLAASLVGCSTITSWQSQPAAPKTASTRGGQTPPPVENSSPLLRLVGTMPVSIDQTFREPATGELLKIRVVRSYAAASGRECREYVVTYQSGDGWSRVACTSGDRWVDARPLRKDRTAGVRAQ